LSGRAKEDAEDGGNEIFEGKFSSVYPMVRGVRANASESQGDDARARGVYRSFDNQSLGDPFSTLAGQDIP
jgi:hypothetical protein